jgi:hypothetical protein
MFFTRSAATGFFGPPFIMIPLRETGGRRTSRQTMFHFLFLGFDDTHDFSPPAYKFSRSSSSLSSSLLSKKSRKLLTLPVCRDVG